MKSFCVLSTEKASAPLEPCGREGHLICQACVLINWPTAEGPEFKKHIKQYVGAQCPGLKFSVKYVQSLGGTGCIGYTGSHRAGCLPFLHNIEEGAFQQAARIAHRQ